MLFHAALHEARPFAGEFARAGRFRDGFPRRPALSSSAEPHCTNKQETGPGARFLRCVGISLFPRRSAYEARLLRRSSPVRAGFPAAFRADRFSVLRLSRTAQTKRKQTSTHAFRATLGLRSFRAALHRARPLRWGSCGLFLRQLSAQTGSLSFRLSPTAQMKKAGPGARFELPQIIQTAQKSL